MSVFVANILVWVVSVPGLDPGMAFCLRTSKPHKYLCPDCGSGLRTITGFRGHMRRKHNRTDVRGVLNSPRIALYTESSLLFCFACLNLVACWFNWLPCLGKQKSTNWQILWTCLVIVTYCLYLIHFLWKIVTILISARSDIAWRLFFF